MFVQILVDNPNSWILPFAKILFEKCEILNHKVSLIHNHKDVKKGDILCLLSCERRFTSLKLNLHNLVVHESFLPKGKGWSPLTWQILEGENEIPITLFEAVDEIDAGDIYLQKTMKFEGHELIEEIRSEQGKMTIDLILEFISKFPKVDRIHQEGESTYYNRRTKIDSKLDLDKSLKSQFNLLRVVDNEKYPAFIEHNGYRYKIAIEKMDKI
jgi:methionyl-tRNA formyltransferase